MTETLVRPAGGTLLDDAPADAPVEQRPWHCIVWDDPVNTMTYVTFVFSSYFGFPRDKAERLMLKVHTTGKAVVASGGREEMETHVTAMHSYGLWATMEQDS
jgi:ATP-dependent Clp protease adaptor protein ClpS